MGGKDGGNVEGKAGASDLPRSKIAFNKFLPLKILFQEKTIKII